MLRRQVHEFKIEKTGKSFKHPMTLEEFCRIVAANEIAWVKMNKSSNYKKFYRMTVARLVKTYQRWT